MKTVVKIMLAVLVLARVVSAQHSEEFVKILGAEDKTVYLDKASVKENGDEIYVWIMQTHIPPLNIESVNEKIFKSKTYYVFNKQLLRYGLLKIVYFNAKGEKIREFDYGTNTDIADYKYSYPIFENSLEKKILDTIYYYYPEMKPKVKKKN